MAPRAVIGDCICTERDVNTLLPKAWLGDQVISYLLQHFARHLDAAQDSRTLLLEPSITFTMAIVGSAEAVREVLSANDTELRKSGATPLTEQLAVADTVIMPVNDNGDASALEGGSHWSLLVFRRRGGEEGRPRFEHYDSCHHANLQQAKTIMRAVAALLLPPAQARGTIQLVKMDSPQQANGFEYASDGRTPTAAHPPPRIPYALYS
jgi:sentrin-specific protease 8